MEAVSHCKLEQSPGIDNLYDPDCNNNISTMSFRDPDYVKNWWVLFKKTINVSAGMYGTQLRVKAAQFRAKMPRGGIDIHFAGAVADSLGEPAICVLVHASYGDF